MTSEEPRRNEREVVQASQAGNFQDAQDTLKGTFRQQVMRSGE